MPLYCAGLCEAVNMAPGRVEMPGGEVEEVGGGHPEVGDRDPFGARAVGERPDSSTPEGAHVAGDQDRAAPR